MEEQGGQKVPGMLGETLGLPGLGRAQQWEAYSVNEERVFLAEGISPHGLFWVCFH